MHLSLQESPHRACEAIEDSPPTMVSTHASDIIRSGAITNAATASRRARPRPELCMLPVAS
eukprot:4605974-Prymnesium_polylepis.1